MTVALAFDIYGTLIDPHGVVLQLKHHLGDQAAEFSRIWREKQLEYSWRRGLMQRYRNFDVCTQQALDYTDQVMRTGLSVEVRESLMQAYRELPAYDDVASSLALLSQAGHRLYPFSNGTEEMVSAVLKHAGIDGFFEAVISVDELQTFKPDPALYRHVIETAGVGESNCWLVSSNAFDVIGAVSAGMKAAWLHRVSSVVFDPWEIEPTRVIQRLDQLPEAIEAA